jgi:hypothetical protein
MRASSRDEVRRGVPITACQEGAAIDRETGDRHGVLGTDFPYQTAGPYERAVRYLTTSGLAPGDAVRGLSANA